MLSVLDHAPVLLRHVDKHISITATDKEYFISLLSARHLLDSFLHHTPSQYNIEALEPCILLEIDRVSLNQ